LHGAASAGAADALAAVKRFVFDEGSVDGAELVNALIKNFDGYEPLRRKLVQEGPKVGNNDDSADEMLVWLFDKFADACEEMKDNGRGGIVRPGSGSAMYYVWLARGHQGMSEPVVGATADGRKKDEFFSSNLAPSHGVTIRGPISVLQTYSKIDYRRICNGGPITMELSDSVFRGPDSIQKVAMLIRTFAELGCEQLQLNTLNVDTLKDAKLHPEKHKNLIVRVWGWSGYFCELGPEYQDHIIARHKYSMQ
jgi:formate C-acetyltransferase